MKAAIKPGENTSYYCGGEYAKKKPETEVQGENEAEDAANGAEKT